MVPVKIITNHDKVITNYESRFLFCFVFLITTKFLQIETGIKNYNNLFTNYDRTIIIIIIIIIIN